MSDFGLFREIPLTSPWFFELTRGHCLQPVAFNFCPFCAVSWNPSVSYIHGIGLRYRPLGKLSSLFSKLNFFGGKFDAEFHFFLVEGLNEHVNERLGPLQMPMQSSMKRHSFIAGNFWIDFNEQQPMKKYVRYLF